MQTNTYTHSLLSAQTIRRLVASHYELPVIENCAFYAAGLHDNYLIGCGNKKFIFRLYRNDWRTDEAVNFELALLDFLGRRSAPVAAPLFTKTRMLTFFIDSPEGRRAAALFHYADGYAPGAAITTKQGALLGKAVANTHGIAAGFKSGHARQVLDISFLLDASIHTIAPFVETETRHYLAMLQAGLNDALSSLSPEAMIYGICTGDVSPHNFHINDQNAITLFDFDQCGYGYRAFEIGKFISSIHHIKAKHEIAKAFIDGYQEISRLNREEFNAISYFEIIAVIWVMAIHVHNVGRIGLKFLQKPFWDRRLAVIRELYQPISDKSGRHE